MAGVRALPFVPGQCSRREISVHPPEGAIEAERPLGLTKVPAAECCSRRGSEERRRESEEEEGGREGNTTKLTATRQTTSAT